MKNSILILGVGNPYRSDDGVGMAVTHRLRERGVPGIRVVEQSGEGAELMEAWKDSSTVFVIDAVSSGAKAGTIHRLDAARDPIPKQFFHYSTHAFSVAEAVELARALGKLPPRLIIYGIEGKKFEAGVGLSPDVAKAARLVAEKIIMEIGHA